MKSKINSLGEYFKEYEKSTNDPEKFWEGIANEFIWKKKWDKVLEYEFNTPKISWFKNAKLNITENIFERQLDDISNKTAIIWEPNNPEEDVINMSNEMIQSVLFPFIPVNAEKFANSISKFVEQGGKLTFSINPQNPLPIISSMGLLVMPDLAIESLGIKLLAE